MLVMVPAEGGDAVASSDTQRAERSGETPCSADGLAICRAMNGAIRLPNDDRLPAMQLLGTPDQRRDRELVIHHETLHDVPSHRCAVRYRSAAGGRLTTVIFNCDGYCVEWCTRLCATKPCVSSKFLPPVFML